MCSARISGLSCSGEHTESEGEDRIANELLLKLGMRVSPRTIRKYLLKLPAPGGNPRRDQRWASFLKNHADAIVVIVAHSALNGLHHEYTRCMTRRALADDNAA